MNNKWYELPRVPTDCKDGTIVIASREPASYFDLQWFPSILDENEARAECFASCWAMLEFLYLEASEFSGVKFLPHSYAAVSCPALDE